MSPCGCGGSRSRLRGLTWRPWLALALRSLGLTVLVLALAEPGLKQTNDHLTVLFVVDRSLSIPEELSKEKSQAGKFVDLRERRLVNFIDQAVELRGPGRERDRAGLIVFGRRPRLELPPTDAPRFNLKELPAALDGNYTDIAAALKLALASFPEGTGKRIVLISDGNENLGNAEEQARLAKTLGAQIDVLPLAAGHSNEGEVLVERIEAPPVSELGSNIPVRVLVRSFNPNVVLGKLTLKQITEKDGVKEIGTLPVKLRRGLNSFSFTRRLTDEQRSYTYEAEILPERIVTEEGKPLPNGPLAGDRVQNNKASTHVVARGRRRLLVLENRPENKENEILNVELVEKLRAARADEAGQGLANDQRKFRVDVRPVEVLNNYPGRDQLTVFLSDYDCVILVNVPADKVSEEQQEVLRANTQDQGCGLVMIGGKDSYGAGGWQNTVLEKALPVDAEIKDLKVQGKGGLVLIMHASEIADGNMWQKKIAKLAIERLGPADMVGVIDFDFAAKWHIPFQEVAGKKAGLLAKVDTLVPGDMPDFDPALDLAFKALTDPKHELTTKHIILISDGDPVQSKSLAQFRDNKVTITSVGVATHGPQEDQKMKLIAQATKGRYYPVKDPNQLPAIYIKESRLISQSFVEQRQFRPLLAFRSGPTRDLPDPPDLRGFVRTTPKSSPLVEVPMVTPRIAEQEFPLLAYWHYGLGKAVAFTSDAGEPVFWSRGWLEGGNGREAMYAKFWEQVISWSLRPTENSGRLLMTTEYQDGKIRITIEARRTKNKDRADAEDGPDTDIKLRGGVTLPAGKGARQTLKFIQKNSGQYEAEIKAEEAGSYFINVQAFRAVKVKGKDGKEREVEEGIESVRAGITLPYSPEFADQESNVSLLRQIQEMTDGREYKEDEKALSDDARAGTVFRRGLPPAETPLPLWPWLIVLAGLLLFSDVAVRRIALDLTDARLFAARVWARLRGLPVPEPERTAYLERLQGRRSPGLAASGGEQAGRRFESAGPVSAPSLADAASMETPTPAGPRTPARDQGPTLEEPQESGDALDRLRRAKKKVWEERDRDKS